MALTGEWHFSLNHGAPCRVIEAEDVFGQAAYLVWVPSRAIVARISSDRLVDLADRAAAGSDEIVFAAAASKVLDTLARDSLVAPLEASVTPLPHQLRALERAVSGDRVRFLLADEVGLGKTIEAGLILRELKTRGLVRRTLIVVPAGLVRQWAAEMKTHFHEDFRPIAPGAFPAWREVAAVGEEDNLWQLHDQVVCPLDSVKPLDARRGWSHEQLARYNRERFEDLLAAGWDLIIIDEAHRLAGSTEQIARFKLAEGLSQASPYLLLLSATPHQGKTDAFRRLIAFLDPEGLPDGAPVRREAVAPFVIRTEKRHAIDASGAALFKPRRTQLVRVAWRETHQQQRALYGAVTEYVREGYNRALRDKQNALGFLMLLMQRLVTSSTAAIRLALERRLEVLDLPVGQLGLLPEDIADEWHSLDGEEQLEAILKARLRGLRDERAEVELLLSAARRCEAQGPDAKVDELLGSFERLRREEGDPELKLLVFTEFVATQAMLADCLRQRGFVVVCLNGGMNLEERQVAQRSFRGEAQVLISTDAGGEGINLQFCHAVVNFDLPWNPMKVEQRIGRVDRIGQQHVVRALNFVLEDTVELRVREVLEQKLDRILEEFGVDKLADVLDAEDSDISFDALYASTLLDPAQAEEQAVLLAQSIRDQALRGRSAAEVLGSSETADPSMAQKVAQHQLPLWTERMTVAYLRSQAERGTVAERENPGYHLRWADGSEIHGAVFAPLEASLAGARHVTLEEPHVRGLLDALPLAVPGLRLPAVILPGISDKVSGTWSLWRVGLVSEDERRQRILPVFISDDGKYLGPTARAVWDRLVEPGRDVILLDAPVEGEATRVAFETVRRGAEKYGASVFAELRETHLDHLRREEAKTKRAFSARTQAIGRIGLAQVRSHRLTQLRDEERAWFERLARRRAAVPELSAILLVRVAPTGSDA